jgi:hypothetical protein
VLQRRGWATVFKDKVAPLKGPHTSKDPAFVQSVAEQNAKDAAALVLSRRTVLRRFGFRSQIDCSSGNA